MKRIAFISVPHLFTESELTRRNDNPDVPLVIASGNSSKSIVMDYSRSLEPSPVEKGMFIENIPAILRRNIRLRVADYEFVEEINQKLIDCLNNYSPAVESLNPGDYFLDLSGTQRLFGRVFDTCGKIVRHLKHAFGLRACIGIGSNTLICRLASQVAGEGGIYEILEPSEQLFIRSLGIEQLPDISPSAKKQLIEGYNISCIGELSIFSKEELSCLFKNEGGLIYDSSRGIARDFLIQEKTEKVLGHEFIVSSESNSDRSMRRHLFNMLGTVCAQMRRERIVPQGMRITIIYQDNYRYTHSGRVRHPSFFEKELYKNLVQHLDIALRRRTCLKKITLSFSRFTTPALQLSLFQDGTRTIRLTEAFDRIQKRFGKESIGYGAILYGEER